MENYMLNGKINPMSGVFFGINNYGYMDTKQVNVTPVEPVSPFGELPDFEEIQRKYLPEPDDD